MKKHAKPAWLKAPIPCGDQLFKLKRQLESRGLSTICQSARCPNMGECWQSGHATFLIMGNRCTRNCGFCSVNHASPHPLDSSEQDQIAEMIEILCLKYAVITSVTRDDLPDRGSQHFADLIRHLKTRFPALITEVLIPDFDGAAPLLDKVLASQPHVIGHNIETIERLYPKVNRPQAHFQRSLSVLRHLAQAGAVTKTGLMVGLGEQEGELQDLFHQLAQVGVQLLTIGQYLQPVSGKVIVDRFYPPEAFDQLRDWALKAGIRGAVAGPFVRSSYHAESLYRTLTVNHTDHPTKQVGMSCVM